MGFDVEAAKAAGYSDAEIADHLAGQAKFDADAARKAGYSDAEIISHIQGAPTQAAKQPAVTFGRKPMTPEQQAAWTAAMQNGWGSGWPKMAYDLGGKIADAGHPFLGYLANLGVNAIPSLMTAVKGLPGSSNADLSRQALATQRQAVLSEGRKLGMSVSPTQVNPTFGNTLLESLAGKAATGQQASNLNEGVAYQIAQREAGLAPTESITSDTLAAARDRLAQPYRDVANLSTNSPLAQPPFKSPADTLEELKQARFDAKGLWNFFNKNGNPALREQALAKSAQADALEQTLEAQAAAAGRTDLVPQLRAARTAIAKNFTVERAMRGSSFDPGALSTLESRANTPLGGDLETIMNMYRDFPTAMKAPQVGGGVGVHQLMPWIGGASGGVGGALLHGMTGGDYGVGAAMGLPIGYAAGVAVPMAARSIILNPAYQKLFANIPQSEAPSLLRLLANPALSPYTGALSEYATQGH